MPEIKQPKLNVRPSSANRSGLSEKATLIFRVFSDNREKDDDLAILDFPSIPKRGAPYSFEGTTRFGLRARDYTPKYVGVFGSHGGIWDVEVSYDNSLKADEPPDPSEADPFTITPRMEKIEVPMEFDLDGRLVRNSAEQKYDPPPLLELYYPVFSIGRTEYTNPCRRMIEFNNRVNGVEFWGFPPGKICMINISPSTSVTWGAPSWQVQYEIGINLYDDIDIWQSELLDSGTKERVQVQDSGNNRRFVDAIAILDAQGKEVTEPVPLDGTGHKLPKDGTPVWNWYRKRFDADLNLLRIPNPFLV